MSLASTETSYFFHKRDSMRQKKEKRARSQLRSTRPLLRLRH